MRDLVFEKLFGEHIALQSCRTAAIFCFCLSNLTPQSVMRRCWFCALSVTIPACAMECVFPVCVALRSVRSVDLCRGNHAHHSNPGAAESKAESFAGCFAGGGLSAINRKIGKKTKKKQKKKKKTVRFLRVCLFHRQRRGVDAVQD